MSFSRLCTISIQQPWCTSLLRMQTTNRFGNGVRKFRHNRKRHQETKSNTDSVETPFQDTCIDSSSFRLRKLVTPLCFTATFSGAVFVSSAIWEYENIRSKAVEMLKKSKKLFHRRRNHISEPDIWSDIKNRWQQLTLGERIFIEIGLVNFLVFCGWRIKRFRSFMMRNFCSNPASHQQCLPMILSVFSHYSAMHLCINMYILHTFVPAAVQSLGAEQFLGVYLTGGVMASLGSYLYKVVMKQPGLSLGASGAIMTILGYICTEFPDTKLGIIFIPNFTFTAHAAIAALITFDTAGVLLRWKFFDHAAHLGGLLFGICWARWGVEHIWQNREPVLQYWHRFRGAIK